MLSAPAWLPADVRTRAAKGATATLAIGRGSDELSTAALAPAAFSSWGDAFGGHVKPDVLASGVAVETATPGADENGFSHFVTVSGTSVAAAVVAGVAARLANSRPALDAEGLRSALVATARPLRGSSLEAQGTGVVDGGRAAATELVADRASISFGRGAGDGWQGRRTLTLRNVSTRALMVDTYMRARGPGIVLRLEPKRVRIPPGRAARIRVTARVAELAKADVVDGLIRIAPRGSQPLVVPWSVLLAPPPPDLIGKIELSERSFEPSDLTPAVLSVRLGTIERVRGRDVLQPIHRLDVYLGGRRTARWSACSPAFATCFPASTRSASRAEGLTATGWHRVATGCVSSPGPRPAAPPQDVHVRFCGGICPCRLNPIKERSCPR